MSRRWRSSPSRAEGDPRETTVAAAPEGDGTSEDAAAGDPAGTASVTAAEASPEPPRADSWSAAGAVDKGSGRFRDLAEGIDAEALGVEMHAWMAEVFPLCRSITGDGLRLTLRSLGGIAPVRLTEVPTGERAFDWTIPHEWAIREAWIKDPEGRKVADFRENNLHVVGYSAPVRARMPLPELRQRIHTLPDRPDWIPYRTSYWQETWGFCMAHRAMEALKDGDYEVCIDSSLKEGSLTYGEFRLQGRTDEEVLISAHACHPSLANDNLSGMAVAAFAARRLKALADAGKPPRYSYRFLFAPVTIGAVAWMSRNLDALPRVRHGLVLSLLGDSGPFTYKRSRRGDAAVDRAAAHALAWSGAHHQVIGFSPYGYDERQFCSPGANLPVGCLMRTPFGRFPEYHTSADNLDYVKPGSLAGSLRALLSILDVLENDGAFVNTTPMGEPQLSRRGLFQARDGRPSPDLMALLWVLNQGDGSKSLLEIAEAANLSFAAVKQAAEALLGCGLLQEKENPQ